MAPRSAKKAAATDNLIGKPICAPRDLWPDFPLPKGQKGWTGKVGKMKDALHHFVSFPDDSSKYFFEDETIKTWLVEEGGEGGGSKAGEPSGGARKKAAAPSGGAGTAAGKRKENEEAAGPSRSSGGAAPSSPGKKAKTAADVAEDPNSMTLARLRDGIKATAEKLDVEAAREAYASILKIKTDRGL